MNVYVDIDDTICKIDQSITDTILKYTSAVPIVERINQVNKLYDEGKNIVYWTARGNRSKIDLKDLTISQLNNWGCKYSSIEFNKPSYDILIDDKVENVNSYWPLKKEDPRVGKASIVSKGWGEEIIFVNNSNYCGKLLNFNTGSKFSMHYHLKKTETWYVLSGEFMFRYIDTRNAEMLNQLLTVGDVLTNEVGEPHQIECIKSGTIVEVSTEHFDTDSYRVLKGDSQKSST
jgi:mannose-6-phosphate isomerase-like protein (cupin superfamily)